MSANRIQLLSDPLAHLSREGPVLINVEEVALLLRISPRTVWRLRSAGKMLAPIRIGGAVRWRRDELLEWIRRNCPPVDKQ